MEELIDELSNVKVRNAEKLKIWLEIRKLIIPDSIEYVKGREEFVIASLAASTEFILFSSELWSGITASEESKIDSRASGDLIQLVTAQGKYRVTSEFGYRKAPTKGASVLHKGVDIALPIGSKLYAPFNGRVIRASRSKNAGVYIEVGNESDSARVIMMHLNGVSVPQGSTVVKGQEIARSGNTGVSTGPHLHIEYQIKRGNKWVYINPKKVGIYNRDFSTDVLYTGSDKTQLRNLGKKINNPMSLIDTGIPWEGKVGTYTAGTGVKFVAFGTIEQGVRAGMLNIYSKASRIKNINEFVSLYVNGGLGTDYTYARNLSRALGVGETEPLNLKDEKTLKAISYEVSKLESGTILSRELLDRAYHSVNNYVRTSTSTVNGTSRYNQK